MSDEKVYDNKNRGVLFKAKTRKHEKSPEYTGKVDVGGVEYKLAAWVNESKKTGQKFFSLRVSRADEFAESPTEKEDKQDEPMPF